MVALFAHEGIKTLEQSFFFDIFIRVYAVTVFYSIIVVTAKYRPCKNLLQVEYYVS